jgi:hypothetical protein
VKRLGKCKNHAMIEICSWYIKIESNKEVMFDHGQNGKDRPCAHWEKCFTNKGNSLDIYGDNIRELYDEVENQNNGNVRHKIIAVRVNLYKMT